MDSQLWGVLMGAAIASIAPLITLRTTQARWRLEKRIEFLRQKKNDIEKLYDDILLKLPIAIQEESYPISMMAAISIRASPEVRKLYYDYMESKERDSSNKKSLILNITMAANKHINSIEKEIFDTLD